MRQIVLDTETTGLEPADGHRIIEIGCVELLERRLTGNTYHQYIQPDRQIDAGAIEVHGITNESLADKPRFADIVDEFLDFVRGAELIIHNAPFDVGFLDHEFRLLETSPGKVTDHCTVLDTLALARRLHPGQRNNLDALCRRYEIDNSQRDLHGALAGRRNPGRCLSGDDRWAGQPVAGQPLRRAWRGAGRNSAGARRAQAPAGHSGRCRRKCRACCASGCHRQGLRVR